ncbi:MAG: TolC family protein [Planctomycetota bacterium]
MHGPHGPTQTLRRAIGLSSAALVVLAGGLTGCSSPFGESNRDITERSVLDAVRREMILAQQTPDYRPTLRDSTVDSLEIPDRRMDELNELSGPTSYAEVDSEVSEDLLGASQVSVRIGLERAIRSAAERNLTLQFQRLAPAISEAQLVQALANFDWTFFVNGQYQYLDQPRTSTTFFGAAVNTLQQSDVSTGLRKSTTTGGTFQLDTTWTWSQNETPGLEVFPDPANTVTVGAQLTQPLLRGAGSDVARATVRLAANNERNAVQALKSTLISTIQQTEEAYWNLQLANESLRVQQRLLRRGEGVRDIIVNRGDLDATQAEIADARAEVESRRAAVIRAERSLRSASDQLKVLINDPDLTIGSELLLLPADGAVEEPIRYSLADALTTAFAERPEVAQAIISLENTGIRKQVARNGILPRLDLNLEARYSALGARPNDAYDDVFDGNFIDYLVGLAFEQPIGNRLANANLREAQLEQMQAITSYQNTIQQVTLEVKNALRDVVTGFQLIEQTRTARVAAAENLRALRVQIETTGGYTAFNLDQWLNRQALLAAAELEEVQSLISYNIAVARLHSVLGTTLTRNNIEFEVENAAD